MRPQHVTRAALAFLLLLVFAHPCRAAEQKLGFFVDVEGEGFFLNPIVTKIHVSEVTKGSLAETAGVKAGDLIIKVDGQTIAGKRALELRSFMKLNPGETRTFRLKRADGTEFDAKITKPKT
jgi:C-terminal processing protease CtpA/Prc